MPNEDLTAAIAALVTELQAQGDPDRAMHEKAYMKSQRDFYGVSKPAIDRLARGFYLAHKPLSADAIIPHIDRLFRATNFDETSLGVSLAACHAGAFNVDHLEHPLSDWFDLCEGWAHCDELAAHVSGAVILADPSGIPTVYAWRTRPVLWTRRASILSHLLAIRARSVPLGLFLDTCESLLDDGEWFIRKAVGWGLRELSTRYPQETFDFLMQHRERASRLTLREGARKLPADLQRQVLE